MTKQVLLNGLSFRADEFRLVKDILKCQQSKLKSNQLLWHYTTLDAFRAICEHNEFRASHISFMNDTLEGEHFRRQMASRIKRFVRGKCTNAFRRDVVKEYMDWILERGIYARNEEEFVISMTEEDDSLPLWREYVPRGEDGVSIGLLPHSDDSFWRKGFKKCYYYDDRNRIFDECALWILRFADYLEELVIRNEEGHYGAIIDRIISYIPFIKSGKFKYENEWRYVIRGVMDGDRHSGGESKCEKKSSVGFDGRKPYFPQVLCGDEGIFRRIACVRISPFGDVGRNYKYCQMMKRAHILKPDVSILKSNIPYCEPRKKI